MDADRALTAARAELAAAIDGMQSLGINAQKIPATEEIPIYLLNTADTRELLDLLIRAQEVAERLDSSRGRSLPECVPLGPGESRGTDIAESISYLRLRVQIEVHGPAVGSRK